MQKKEKLAAGGHKRHMIRYVNKCLHSSATAMPAASCSLLLFVWTIFLSGSKIAPPNIWGTNLKLLTGNSSFHHPPSMLSAFNTN